MCALSFDLSLCLLNGLGCVVIPSVTFYSRALGGGQKEVMGEEEKKRRNSHQKTSYMTWRAYVSLGQQCSMEMYGLKKRKAIRSAPLSSWLLELIRSLRIHHPSAAVLRCGMLNTFNASARPRARDKIPTKRTDGKSKGRREQDRVSEWVGGGGGWKERGGDEAVAQQIRSR